MVPDAINMLNMVFAAVSSWFTQVLTASGGVGLFLGMLFILMTIRYLLAPLFGSAGSDRAKKRNNDGDE